MRQPVCERGAVVEDELVGAVRARGPVVDGGLKGPVLLPEGENAFLHLRKVRQRLDARLTVQGIVAFSTHCCSSYIARARTTLGGCLKPRYHPACPARCVASHWDDDGSNRPVLLGTETLNFEDFISKGDVPSGSSGSSPVIAGSTRKFILAMFSTNQKGSEK